MDSTFFYFSPSDAVDVHDFIIDKTGGLPGTKNFGSLSSVLEHIQNDSYYPTFEDKLAHLVFAVIKFHSFNDGNKRSSIALGAYFLQLNGYGYCVSRFVAEMENVVVWIAEGKVSKALLKDLAAHIIENMEYSEALKLELWEALQS